VALVSQLLFELYTPGCGITHLVHVPNDKVVCQRPLDGNVLLLVEPNTVGTIAHRPVIIRAIIPSSMVLLPAIGAGKHALGGLGPVATEIVDVPRVHIVGSRG
jgi:hypothetical protein